MHVFLKCQLLQAASVPSVELQSALLSVVCQVNEQNGCLSAPAARKLSTKKLNCSKALAANTTATSSFPLCLFPCLAICAASCLAEDRKRRRSEASVHEPECCSPSIAETPSVNRTGWVSFLLPGSSERPLISSLLSGRIQDHHQWGSPYPSKTQQAYLQMHPVRILTSKETYLTVRKLKW